MEERKTIFSYLGQIFMYFGIMMVLMDGFCLLFGDHAKEISPMFSLGSQGLSVKVMAEFFLVAAVIVVLRIIFFTDLVIRKMSVTVRTVWMVLLVLVSISICIFIFEWFPVDKWQPWVLFFLCFAVCFMASTLVAALKEKAENRKMEEALKRLKQEKKE